MNATVQAALSAALAELEAVRDFPTEPFGYGADLWCEADLSPDMVEVEGDSMLALAQALVRRLDCPRGGLLDDLDYGIDLRASVNVGMTAAEVNSLAGAIRAEMLKDDRVTAARVTVAPTPTGSELAITIALEPVDSALGTFDLTLSASSAAVVLEELRGAA